MNCPGESFCALRSKVPFFIHTNLYLRLWPLKETLGFNRTRGDLRVNHGLFVLESGGCRRGRRFRGFQLCPSRQWDAMWIRGLEFVLANEPGRLSVHGCESCWLSGQRGNHGYREHHAAGGPPHHPLSCPRAPRGPHNPLLGNGRQISRGPPARRFHLSLGH